MPNSNEHIVTSYEEELTALAGAISEMGGQVEVAVLEATKALLKLDHATAREIIAADKAIDAMQLRIDETAVSMIARRQPMAGDLRMIITSMQVAGDLERVGDMSKQLCKRALQIEGLSLAPKFYNGVKHMTDLVLAQLSAALNAYTSRDSQAAVQVCNRDGEIDSLYTSIFRELLTYMMEDPRNITQCTHLLFCAKSLERIGDHATNVAEAAYYLETGKKYSTFVDEEQRVQLKP